MYHHKTEFFKIIKENKKYNISIRVTNIRLGWLKIKNK